MFQILRKTFQDYSGFLVLFSFFLLAQDHLWLLLQFCHPDVDSLLKDFKVFRTKSNGAGGEKSMTKSAMILGANLQFLTTVVGLSQVPTQQDAIPTEASIRPCYNNKLICFKQ